MLVSLPLKVRFSLSIERIYTFTSEGGNSLKVSDSARTSVNTIFNWRYKKNNTFLLEEDFDEHFLNCVALL